MFCCDLGFFHKTGFFLGGYKSIDANINVFNKIFFLGKRKSFFIVNYYHFLYNFRISLFFLYRLISLRGKVLGFDHRSYIRRCLIFFLKRANQNYIVKHWIGGTLTNFKNFQIFFSQISKGFLSVKKYFDLYLYYYGLRSMYQIPSLIILTNTTCEDVSLQETFRLGVPILGLVNITTKNTYGITFPIFCNQYNFKSILIFYSIIGDSLIYGWLKPVSFFFSKFFKRLKMFRKKLFLEKMLNYNIYNPKLLFFFQKLYKTNVNKFLLLNFQNSFFLHFLKKLKILKFKVLFNFKFYFQKKFFKNSFIFLWFLRKLLKSRRKKRRKIFKRFFNYKKKNKYKIFKFLKKTVKFVFKKTFKKFLVRYLKKTTKLNYVIKYNKYKNYYKKLNQNLILKKANFEEEHLETILEEFDELPEERKIKALKKLYETFEKLPLNYLLSDKLMNKKYNEKKTEFVKTYNFKNIRKKLCFHFKNIQTVKNFSNKSLIVFNLIKFLKKNQVLKNLNYTQFLYLKIYYNKFLYKRRSENFILSNFLKKDDKKNKKKI